MGWSPWCGSQGTRYLARLSKARRSEERTRDPNLHDQSQEAHPSLTPGPPSRGRGQTSILPWALFLAHHQLPLVLESQSHVCYSNKQKPQTQDSELPSLAQLYTWASCWGALPPCPPILFLTSFSPAAGSRKVSNKTSTCCLVFVLRQCLLRSPLPWLALNSSRSPTSALWLLRLKRWTIT